MHLVFECCLGGSSSDMKVLLHFSLAVANILAQYFHWVIKPLYTSVCTYVLFSNYYQMHLFCQVGWSQRCIAGPQESYHNRRIRETTKWTNKYHKVSIYMKIIGGSIQISWYVVGGSVQIKGNNLADSQVEKSGSPPAILGVRMPGFPLILHTGWGCGWGGTVLPTLLFSGDLCERTGLKRGVVGCNSQFTAISCQADSS